MKIISGFERVEKREILDCRIKSLKELLKFWGCNVSSFELLILCEAITTRYGRLNYKQHNIYGAPYVTSTNMNIHTNLFQKLDIHFKCEKISNDEEGWERIKQLIDDGIPVLVELDGSVFMKRRKEHYIDMHYVSYILVVGYDEETREVAVVLTNSFETDTYITMNYEEFQSSRIKNCYPYEVSGKCYYLTDNIDVGDKDIEFAIRNSLKNISSLMLKGGEEKNICSEEIDMTDISVGLVALKNFIRDYKSKALGVLSNKRNRAFYQLELLILRNNIQYGTLTCYRDEFAKGLHIIEEKYNIPAYGKAGDLLEDAAGYWKKLIWYMGVLAKNRSRISYRGMKRIYRLIQKIYRKEKRAFIIISAVR